MSIMSFIIGGIYRIILEKNLVKKAFSKELERIEAIEFAYYLMATAFLLIGLVVLAFR